MSIAGLAQTDSVVSRLWLVGDAGLLKKGRNPQLELLRQLNLLDGKSTVLFLGDNIYPTGLPDSQSRNYPLKKAILDKQIDLVKNTQARVYILPGNHDWKEGRNKGWEQVIHQYKYVQSLGLTNVFFCRKTAVPGRLNW